jgi:osmotically inducible lipoprotein OsmB
MNKLRTINKIVAVLVLVFMLTGCAGMSTTQQRTLSGGAIGAGAGALIGGVAGGSPGVGAAVGAGAGALGGYLYDRSQRGY